MNINDFIDKLLEIQREYGNNINIIYDDLEDWYNIENIEYSEFEHELGIDKLVILKGEL
jgi:hypothetical protein